MTLFRLFLCILQAFLGLLTFGKALSSSILAPNSDISFESKFLGENTRYVFWFFVFRSCLDRWQQYMITPTAVTTKRVDGRKIINWINGSSTEHTILSTLTISRENITSRYWLVDQSEPCFQFENLKNELEPWFRQNSIPCNSLINYQLYIVYYTRSNTW